MPDKFEDNDRAWMERTKNLRRRRVNPALFKGFSASVEARIQKEPTWAERLGELFPARAWVPVMAVLVLVTVGIVKYPDTPASATELEEEIQVLRELGEWTVSDELATDTATLDDLEEESV